MHLLSHEKGPVPNAALAVLSDGWPENVKEAAVDLETTSLDPSKGEIRLLSWATAGGAWVTDNVGEVAALLADPTFKVVFHNAAFDVSWLQRKGYTVRNYVCTMVMAQTLHGISGKGSSLQALSREYLGIALDKGLQSSDNWSGPLTEDHLRYAKEDAEATYRLYRVLNQLIRAAGLEPVVEREMRALPALIRMQMDGMGFCMTGWKVDLEQYQRDAEILEHSIRGTLGLPHLNLKAPGQLREALLGVGVRVESTKDAALALVEHQAPVVKELRKLKKIQKILSAYGDRLQERVGQDGRLRGEWKLLGAKTGRIVCSNPNLQGLPGKAKRHCVADPGMKIVWADYSQIEVRVLAQVSRDKAMIESFAQNVDLHRQTAARILGKPVELVTEQERKVAKAIVFGMSYGMTGQGLWRKLNSEYGLGVTLEAAERLRHGYFEAFPSVRRFQELMVRAETVKSLGGRRWRAEDLKPIQRFNYPVQGSAADGFKEALGILIRHLPSNWKLVAAVHDEVVLEVPESAETEAKRMLVEDMKAGMTRFITDVPVVVEANAGDHWAK